MKFTNLRSLILIAAALMFVAGMEVVAQDKFKPGDKVMASPSSLMDDRYYVQCTVIKFDRGANAYQLDCDGTGYVVQSKYIRAPKATDGVEEAEPAENPVEEKPVVEKPDNLERTQTNQGTFKRGAKVMASPSMLKEDKYYQQCTVIKFDRSANAYQLDCDGYGYVVPPRYVRATRGTDAVEEEERVEKPEQKNKGARPQAEPEPEPEAEEKPAPKKPAAKPKPKPTPEPEPEPVEKLEEVPEQKNEDDAASAEPAPAGAGPQFSIGDCVNVNGAVGVIKRADGDNFYVQTEAGMKRVPFSSASKMKKATGCG